LSMQIAIASGKGGTGKTLIATNLAAALAADSAQSVTYVDCDVEEPNGHIFFDSEPISESNAELPVPRINMERCNLCGDCADICQFNALAVLGQKVLVFESLCHGCGACVELCPERAITESPRIIGNIQKRAAGVLKFFNGSLNIGEALAPPVIRAVKKMSRLMAL